MKSSESKQRRRFNFRCSREVFTEKELETLEKHGAEFARLANGQRLPKAQDQVRFVEVARGQREPETVYEKAWAKYMWRVHWEQANRSAMGGAAACLTTAKTGNGRKALCGAK